MTTRSQNGLPAWAWGMIPGALVGAGIAVIFIYLMSTTGSHFPAESFSTSWVVRSSESVLKSLTTTITREAAVMGWPIESGSHAFWYASRAAGLMGYLLLWAVNAWGLILSSKIFKGVIATPTAMQLHAFLSILMLVFATFHGLVLLGDRYMNFSLADVLYPFVADYETGWLALGQLGFYLGIALTVSFYLRKIIGHKMWRRLHFLSFLIYVLVLIHGLTIGSDANQPAVLLMYIATCGVIVFLVYYRLLTSQSASDQLN